MSYVLRFDARGRITIPSDLRAGLGTTVVAIRTPRGIVLHPAPRHVDFDLPAADASGDEGAESEVAGEAGGAGARDTAGAVAGEAGGTSDAAPAPGQG